MFHRLLQLLVVLLTISMAFTALLNVLLRTSMAFIALLNVLVGTFVTLTETLLISLRIHGSLAALILLLSRNRF